MDKIYNFLIETENEYKSKYMSVEHEINVLKEQIQEINGDISNLEKSIDRSYELLSSSQMANLHEKTELDVKREILANYNDELLQQQNILNKVALKLSTIKDVIKSYVPADNNEIADKINFIIKLIPVDAPRAVLELQNIQDALRKE